MKKSIYIYLMLFVLPISLWGQTTTENYIKTTTYQVGTTNGTAGEDAKFESVTYFDGLGRSVQSINARAGGNKENIVNYTYYDFSATASKQYLPWASPTGQGLDFIQQPTLLDHIEEFYDTNKYQNTLNPYSQSRVEPSPLLRIQEQGAPGNLWQIDSVNDTDHTVKFTYATNNTADQVIYHRVTFPTGSHLNPKLEEDGIYATAALFKNVVKDENWQPGDGNNRTTEEFTNRKGQIILKRTYDGNAHDTYFVYDDFGNLTYVLPPNTPDLADPINFTDFQTTWPLNDFLTSGSNIPGPVMFEVENNIMTTNALTATGSSYSGSLKLQTVKSITVSPTIPDMPIGIILGVTGFDTNNNPITQNAGTMSIVNGDFVVDRTSSSTYLSFIFSATVALPTEIENDLDAYIYQYKYDNRNRLIRKKIPGKGWEYTIYDDLDRPILTRDANLQADNEWLFIKYDAFDRVAYTGIYTASNSKSGSNSGGKTSSPLNEEQSLFSNPIGDTYVNYTNNSFPNDNLEVLKINYYDTYVDSDGLSVPNIVFGQLTTTNTKNLPTVSRVRVLGTNDWVTTINGYDEKGRAIYAASNNDYLNTSDVVKTRLDFTGKTMATRTAHTKDSNPTIVTLDYFDYDHAGRILTHMQQIDTQPVQLIAQNKYDELGQLQYKKVGGELFDGGIGYIVNMTHSNDGTFTKTSGGSSNWNAGIATTGSITSDGGLHFTIRSTGKKMAVGFTETNNNNTASDIEFGFQFKFTGSNPSYYQFRNPNGTVSGTNSYQLGDRFSIERVGGTYSYIHNDEIVYSYTQVTSQTSLLGDGGFLTEGGAISDFTIYAMEVDSPLQKVDFKYNIRGWLTEINSINSLTKNASSDLFNFKINYTSVEGSAGDPGKAVPLYNGNIAQTIWKTSNIDAQKRTYGYKYDALNRIRTAYSRKGNNLDVAGNHSVWGINYDKIGNILALTRNGYNGVNGPAMWDQLLYTYEGNQLQNVEDISTSSLNHEGFRDRTTATSTDYTYDDNGNMLSDYNKGIINIDYNHLNLPESISIQAVNGHFGGTINYVYTASGAKLEKEFIPNVGSVSVTEYIGHYIYHNNVLQFMSQPEGYVHPVSGSYEYVFQYTDHLGNVRLSYSDSDHDGNVTSAEIVEESNYYAFGLKQKGYNNTTIGGNNLAQKWTFGGKEFQDDLDLEWYDHGTRNYNPALGRWMNPDPLADFAPELTPYRFAGNNPILLNDPTGLWEFIFDEATGRLSITKTQETDTWEVFLKQSGLDQVDESLLKELLGDDLAGLKDTFDNSLFGGDGVSILEIGGSLGTAFGSFEEGLGAKNDELRKTGEKDDDINNCFGTCSSVAEDGVVNFNPDKIPYEGGDFDKFLKKNTTNVNSPRVLDIARYGFPKKGSDALHGATFLLRNEKGDQIFTKNGSANTQLYELMYDNYAKKLGGEKGLPDGILDIHWTYGGNTGLTRNGKQDKSNYYRYDN